MDSPLINLKFLIEIEKESMIGQHSQKQLTVNVTLNKKDVSWSL